MKSRKIRRELKQIQLTSKTINLHCGIVQPTTILVHQLPEKPNPNTEKQCKLRKLRTILTKNSIRKAHHLPVNATAKCVENWKTGKRNGYRYLYRPIQNNKTFSLRNVSDSEENI